LSRRAFLLLPLAGCGVLPLAGCGFEPLHAPRAGGVPGAPGDARLAEELAAVRVANIPERNGQVMRRNLERRLEGDRAGAEARYELRAAVFFTSELLGYRRDGAISRVRLLATVQWVLTTRDDPPVIVARNQARTLDAYNIPDLQFFAADISREDMERRLIEELSDQVYLGVVAAMRRRVAAA
jgi:LPS-assembly lipoprotein